MAKVQQVKDLFLKATRLSDVAALFRLLDEDFALHLEDGKLEIELSESQYFECFVYDEPSQVEKRAKETIFGRFCVLGISSDGERWIFAKRGIEGRDVILIHPDDLKRLGLKDGQRVTVTSATGAAQICAANRTRSSCAASPVGCVRR